MNLHNFTKTSATVTITATTTTARVALGDTSNPTSVLIYNAHTALVYVEFGDSTVEATSAGVPIPSGGWITLNAQDHDYVAALAASGNGTIYFTPGEGT